MSGPIVRKYGFPNHDKIFGKREIPHGVDQPPQAEDKPPTDTPPSAPAPTGSRPSSETPSR